MIPNKELQGIKDYYADKHEGTEDHSQGIPKRTCNLCGKSYYANQRHGPISWDGVIPIGYNESETCIECSNRSPCLVFERNEVEILPICQDCIEVHHSMDFFTMKWQMILGQMYQRRLEWNKDRELDLGRVC